MEEFLHMGGYARFVWPAYGFGLLVIVWNIWSALRLQRTALASARRRAVIGRTEGNDNGNR
jgi:heme exporter protein CcmD